MKHLQSRGAAFMLFTAAIVLMWNFYVVSPSDRFVLRFAGNDLYQEHYPMAAYGFAQLREGILPLWNPWQLCGIPFLAVPHVGLLYPGNVAYLLMGTGLATEITYLAHLVFAAMSMFCLVSSLGMGFGAGIAAGITFAMSGWMIHYANQASLVSGMCWLPMTVLLMHRTMSGGGYAPIALAIAVTAQILNGAHEFLLYNVYAGGAFVLVHVVRLVHQRRWMDCLARLGAVALAGVLGCALAGVQLLPSMELVLQSSRAPGSLTTSGTENALWGGVLTWDQLMHGWTLSRGAAAVGFLPLVGLLCGLRMKQWRGVWIACALLAALSLHMALGGYLYDLYFETPMGGLFRRPSKLLHLYAFALAIMAAFGVDYLSKYVREGAVVSRAPAEWALMLLAASAAYFYSEPPWSEYILVVVCLLALAVTAAAARVRTAAVGLLVILQTASLMQIADPPFEEPMTRPFQKEEVFDTYSPMFDRLKREARFDRIHAFANAQPALTAKQATMRQFFSPIDYEALVLSRQTTFLNVASGQKTPVIAGRAELTENSNLALFDLMSVRFYVSLPLSVDNGAVQSHISKGNLREHFRSRVQVASRASARPRAYLVSTGIAANDAADAMRKLRHPTFNAKSEVVLEDVGSTEVLRGPKDWFAGSAGIVRAEAERVEIDVTAYSPGYLVLTDTFYPGWKALVDGVEVPILRANYLFRAVALDGGRRRVTFVYEPGSFRIGIAVSVAAALCLSAWALLLRRRARAPLADTLAGSVDDASAVAGAGDTIALTANASSASDVPPR